MPADHLIGPEGSGFMLAQARLGPGRIHHCMRWLGQSQRAFDMLCERALSRYTHGSLLAEKQTVQNWIADSRAEMHAARLMTLQAAWKMDRDGAAAARVEIAMIKYYGAQVLYNVIDRVAAGARLARLLDGPAARGDVPLGARRAHLRRSRRGAPPDRRAPDAEGRTRASRGPDRAHPARARPRPARSSPRRSSC